MDLANFVPSPESYDVLARHQIDAFFTTNKFVTQQQCDDYAAKVVARDVCCTLVQGQTSYTLMATDGSAVVQFRSPRSQIDLDHLSYARNSYGQRFIPDCEYLGAWHRLHVYKLDFVPGEALESARRQLFRIQNKHLLMVTMEDYAEFFSSSWMKSSTKGLNLDQVQIYGEYDTRLGILTINLPPRYLAKLNGARSQLWRLFDGDYPVVLNHAEPSENNVHVDCTTGHITGVVDCLDAAFGPFGRSLWAVDMALGVQTQSRWHWHAAHEQLRQHFWDTFSNMTGGLTSEQIKAIKLGRMVGLLLAFGFCNGVPVSEDDASLVCLDALLMVDFPPNDGVNIGCS